jgi:periplasmic divalent cation tolerance protein
LTGASTPKRAPTLKRAPTPKRASTPKRAPGAPARSGASALLAVYTTIGELEQARELARELVQRRLAACAQICPIESFYHWRGELQNEPEFRLLLKTTAARYADLEAAIRSLHPYELPAIYAVAVVRGSTPYERWVSQGCEP